MKVGKRVNELWKVLSGKSLYQGIGGIRYHSMLVTIFSHAYLQTRGTKMNVFEDAVCVRILAMYVASRRKFLLHRSSR